MKIIEQSYALVHYNLHAIPMIEQLGRVCYQSEEKVTPDSADKFVDMITKRGHHSVIEHALATVKFITNRGVTHELVRHRLASYSQESTRYVDYQKEMEFIKPVWWEDNPNNDDASIARIEWQKAMCDSENHYKKLRANGWKPEQAREVLPNSLKTEIVMTANFREWMHVFTLRCNKKSHPQMVALMRPCYQEFLEKWPAVFKHVTF